MMFNSCAKNRDLFEQLKTNPESQAKFILSNAQTDPELCILFLDKLTNFDPRLVSTVTRMITENITNEVSSDFLLFFKKFLSLIKDVIFFHRKKK